jgi:SAM-dependent methyltransferase
LEAELLGEHDVFCGMHNWDAATTAQWVEALRLRAQAPDQKAIRQEIVQRARLEKGDCVVENGCGTGALLLDLAAVVGSSGKVIGCEPQPGLAEAARQAVAQASLSALVRVLPCKLEEAGLEPGSAAATIAQTVLIHVPKARLHDSLAAMISLVRPLGRIISADQDGDTWVIHHPDRDLTRRIAQFNTDQRYADGWRGRQLWALFREHGLQNVEVVAYAHLEAGTGGYSFEMAMRISKAAADAGVISHDQCRRWQAELDDTVQLGNWFSSMTYFICTGSKPAS